MALILMFADVRWVGFLPPPKLNLLQMEKSHFKFSDLLLHRRSHLVALAVGFPGFTNEGSEMLGI